MAKLTKKDKQNITNAYFKKYEEYDKLSLDELKAIYDKGKLSSTYKQAIIDVVAQKLKKQKLQVVEEKLKEAQETKNNENIEEAKEL